MSTIIASVAAKLFRRTITASFKRQDKSTTRNFFHKHPSPRRRLFSTTTTENRTTPADGVTTSHEATADADTDGIPKDFDEDDLLFSSSPPTPSDGPSGSTNFAFDRRLKLLQKDGAARAHAAARRSPGPAPPVDYDYFRTEVANRLVERLDDIIREDGFPLALEIGSGPGYVHRAVCSDEGMDGVGGIGGVRKLVQLESSAPSLHRDDGDTGSRGLTEEEAARCGTYRLPHDEEGSLPFPSGTFDLVLSSASLHWVNDLPDLLLEAKRVLKPDGCLLFAVVGGSSTLHELRSSLLLAEMEREGGVSSHVGPFVDVSDVGSLLTEAGFALTTVDVDTMTLSYPNGFVLMEHLQRMGEGNAGVNRRDGVGRGTFLASACVYEEMFGMEGGDGGETEVEATVQVIYAIGWSPHESQQKPDERGSATLKVGETVVERTTADIDMKPLT